MPIRLVHLNDVAVEVVYDSSATYADFSALFQTLSEMETIEYILSYGVSMYNTIIRLHEEEMELFMKCMNSEKLKKMVLWLPERAKGHDILEQYFESMDVSHKLFIVSDLEAVKAKIRETGHP